jgi:hypothetical protein
VMIRGVLFFFIACVLLMTSSDTSNYLFAEKGRYRKCQHPPLRPENDRVTRVILNTVQMVWVTMSMK